MLFILLTSLCCCLFSSNTAEGDDVREIRLAPNSTVVSNSVVPGLDANFTDADITKPAAAIEPATGYEWIASPGKPFAVTIRVSEPDQTDTAVLTVWDWGNRPVEQLSLNVPCAQKLRFVVAGRGTYMLTLDGMKSSRHVFRLVRSFSVCPSNVERREKWAEDEFFVGICSFPARQSWGNSFGPAHPPGLTPDQSWRKDVDLVARMGIQVVRIDAVARANGDSSGQVDFTVMDELTRAYADRNITLDLQLWAPSRTAANGTLGQDWRLPAPEEPYRQYVRESVSRYTQFAKFIEVWNEPDNLDFWRGTPEEHIRQYTWALDEIRKHSPGALVANGGYCLMKPEWTPIYASKLSDKADLLAYHAHGNLVESKKVFSQILRIHRKAGHPSLKIVNTEMGCAAWRLDQEQEQAIALVQKLLFCWAHRHCGALLYCSRDIGGPRLRPNDPDWGLIDHFMCPRFAYGAVSAFIDTYAGARLDKILVESDNLHAYSFKAEGKIIVAMFTLTEPEAVSFKSKCRSVTLVDPMGNRRLLPIEQPLMVQARRYPVTLILNDAEGLEFLTAGASGNEAHK